MSSVIDDDLWSAIGDPTRRRLLDLLLEVPDGTATTLSQHLPISRQAVAKHLVLLRDAGLVAADRAGRETRFTAVAAPLDDLAAWAEHTGRRWDDRLARLRERLATSPDHAPPEGPDALGSVARRARS